MAQCRAVKPDGSHCERMVGASRSYCYAHDPANAERRKIAASRGGRRAGKGRPLSEIAGIKNQLQGLADNVVAGEVDRADAAVAGQLLNYLLRALDLELKAREHLELESKMAEIERRLDERDAWRAG